MQIVVIVVLAHVSAAYLIWRLLSKAGIGRRGGKPDCGCGHCADSKAKPHLALIKAHFNRKDNP